MYNQAPLGAKVRITDAQLPQYILHTKHALQKAEQNTDDKEQYEFWSRWTLWYYDIILYSFFFFERNRMYDAMDTALLDKNIPEAYRLVVLATSVCRA